MHFLIYVPGGRDVGDLAAVGLSDLAANAFPRNVDRLRGPDGGNGVIFGWPVNGALCPLSFQPDEQTWIPAVAFGGLEAGRYMVGFWNDRRPTPGELQRPRFIAGNLVALGDGNEWSVPNCSQIPHAWAADDDGVWRLKVKAEFRSIVERAKAWETVFRTSSGVPAGDALEFALQALSINYRMTREVATFLELFTNGDEGTLNTCFAHCIGAGGDS